MSGEWSIAAVIDMIVDMSFIGLIERGAIAIAPDPRLSAAGNGKQQPSRSRSRAVKVPSSRINAAPSRLRRSSFTSSW